MLKTTNRFTLIELLVVASIFGILVSLLQPTLVKMTTSAKRIECASILKVIGNTVNFYVDDHKGYYPGPLWTRFSSKANWGLGKYLATYFEPQQMDLNNYSNWNKFIPELMCPSNNELELNNDPRDRMHYAIGVDEEDGIRAFGRPEFTSSSTGTHYNIKYTAHISQLSQFSSLYMFKDYDLLGQASSNSYPTLPVHGSGMRNKLFLDLHLELEDAYVLLHED